VVCEGAVPQGERGGFKGRGEWQQDSERREGNHNTNKSALHGSAHLAPGSVDRRTRDADCATASTGSVTLSRAALAAVIVVTAWSCSHRHVSTDEAKRKEQARHTKEQASDMRALMAVVVVGGHDACAQCSAPSTCSVVGVAHSCRCLESRWACDGSLDSSQSSSRLLERTGSSRSRRHAHWPTRMITRDGQDPARAVP
jgi:hypothetical protein